MSSVGFAMVEGRDMEGGGPAAVAAAAAAAAGRRAQRRCCCCCSTTGDLQQEDPGGFRVRSVCAVCGCVWLCASCCVEAVEGVGRVLGSEIQVQGDFVICDCRKIDLGRSTFAASNSPAALPIPSQFAKRHL